MISVSWNHCNLNHCECKCKFPLSNKDFSYSSELTFIIHKVKAFFWTHAKQNFTKYHLNSVLYYFLKLSRKSYTFLLRARNKAYFSLLLLRGFPWMCQNNIVFWLSFRRCVDVNSSGSGIVKVVFLEYCIIVYFTLEITGG